jgi:hypothetical protein
MGVETPSGASIDTGVTTSSGPAVVQREADAPLVIDPEVVLACPVSLQLPIDKYRARISI